MKNGAQSGAQKELRYLVGGTALTMNPQFDILEDVVIEIQNGCIQAIHSDKHFSPPTGEHVLETTGCLVMPGLINGHTHLPMNLLRGVADDLPFKTWLEERILPLERKVCDAEFVSLGTQLACAEMIQSGITTFNDMFYFEEVVAEAAAQSGMRGVCGQTVAELGAVQKLDDIEKSLEVFLETVATCELISPAVAPHSIYALSEKLWKDVIRFADRNGIRLHLHLSETQGEVDECMRQMGLTPTAYCERLGLWEHQVIAAHATCLSEDDVALLGKYGAGVVHNPESNLKLGTRIAPVQALRNAGVNVALGTDGTASNNNLDLLQEVDVAAKLQSYQSGVGALTARDAVAMLTIEGAKCLRLENQVGSLEVGKAADLVVLDLKNPRGTPFYDPYSYVVYMATVRDVTHCIVNGVCLLKDGRFVSLDFDALYESAVGMGRRVQKHLSDSF